MVMAPAWEPVSPVSASNSVKILLSFSLYGAFCLFSFIVFFEARNMRKNNRKVVVLAGTFLVCGSVTSLALSFSGSWLIHGEDRDPCSLGLEEIELREFVSSGLEEKTPTIRKTTGTVTKIRKNHNETTTFFVERLDATTRERTCLRVEGYNGDPSINVGDYLSLAGALSVNGSDYWLDNPSIVTDGPNPYGEVTSLDLLTNDESLDIYQNGRYVKALKFNVKGLAKISLTSVVSDGDELIYDTWDNVGDSFYPLIIAGGSKEKTEEIADKIVLGQGDFHFKAEGNLVALDDGFAIQISDSDDLLYVDDSEKNVNFYAINDFHGSVPKIASLVTYMKKKDDGNAVFINSGDMWQGSMESNTNRGKLLTLSYDQIGFDCFTLGNHEFDWGLDYIKKNRTYTKTPFLGANIYHWDKNTRQYGTFADELVEPYVIKDLDNGLRVGIIGLIGQDQITSITSTYVDTIGFQDPATIVPSLSQELKEEKGCDIVVLSAHAGQESVSGSAIYSNVDAVFCAHTHQAETGEFGGVPYIQGGSYGNYVSTIDMVYSGGSIASRSASNVVFDSYDYEEDATMAALVKEYSEPIEKAAKETVATVSGYLSNSGGVDRLVAHALAEEASEEGYNIDLAMTNKARSGIRSGTLTYSSLYQSLPFDNVVYIVDVKGEDLLLEAKYNAIYRLRTGAFSASDTYRIAIIDYVILHQNSQRNFDYFSHDFEIVGNLAKEGVDIYNYRDITADFLREKKTIDSSDYSTLSSRNNANLLTQSVSF